MQRQTYTFETLYDPRVRWDAVDMDWRVRFLATMRELYAIVDDLAPQLIIYPMRGAGPMLYSLRALYANNMPYHELCLPIGTTVLPDHLQAEAACRKRVSESEALSLRANFPRTAHIPNKLDLWVKWAIIQQSLDSYFAGHEPNQHTTIAMVDEMQNGGTATKAAYLIDAYLQDRGLAPAFHLIAIQDERASRHNHHRRAKSYHEILKDANPAARRITFHQVETPLFTVDNSPLLPLILTDMATPIATRFRVVHNHIIETLLVERLQEGSR